MATMCFRSHAMEKVVYNLAQLSQTPVSVQRLIQLGINPTLPNVIENAKFIHRELPIRLARRIVELQTLPYGLSKMPSVKKVINSYQNSLEAIRCSLVPDSKEDNAAFCDLLNELYLEHSSVLRLMAMGMRELKSQVNFDSFSSCPFLKDFLDRFFMARIGIRVLAAHHMALRESKDGYAGVFKCKAVVRDIVTEAIEEAEEMCFRCYGFAPEVIVLGGVDLSLPYIPSHLHYCIFELLKNSMRAHVENVTCSHSASLPPIQIVIAEGANDIAVKVSDVGKGIPRFDVPRMWQYAFTTSESACVFENHARSSGSEHSPMTGLGYGLPISRLYARSFGGDLSIISMEGHGTDAYLHLRSVDATEFVPE